MIDGQIAMDVEHGSGVARVEVVFHVEMGTPEQIARRIAAALITAGIDAVTGPWARPLWEEVS